MAPAPAAPLLAGFGDVLGWLFAAVIALVHGITLVVGALWWLLGLIFWPVGQLLGFVIDILGAVFGWLGTVIYDVVADIAPGATFYIDLISFGKGGWGDDLWTGLQLTLKLAVISLSIGLTIGLLGAGAKLAPNKWLNIIGNGYTTLIRGLPELLTLMLIYYGLLFGLQGLLSTGILPLLCDGTGLPDKLALIGLGEDAARICVSTTVQIDGFSAGVVALSLVFGAFSTEVLRGAILAVPKGQLEAARAIGMSRRLTIRRILLPQVWRYAMPGLGNLWLIMIKDTSLVSVIALDELMRKTSIAVGVTKQPFFFYSVACLIYLAITGVSMIATTRIERWASRGVRRA
ncbi:ABC transporter permease [Zavarzinia sp.]|uniref:ABC transporter permease n=1 Tax=Zavarzinia sp. TaxID=2027920 RepID=UPI003BB6332D